MNTFDDIATRYINTKFKTDDKFEIVQVQSDEPYDCMPYYDYKLFINGKEFLTFKRMDYKYGEAEQKLLVNAFHDIEWLLLEVKRLNNKLKEIEKEASKAKSELFSLKYD